MLNKLLAFSKTQGLFSIGDKIVCAVSGGADSMALLWAMVLLRDEGKIQLECAHFNHHLRGEESDRDAAFVESFCKAYRIPFHLGSGCVQAGKKGLEAAAREARYGFLRTLDGKIATAHTADDNAETILLHLVRGTGLKGLGGISSQNGNVIRPMLSVTRKQVLAFLSEYHISYVEDSSNKSDDFLRNRLRHRIMPILLEENPRIGENLSEMALRLRQDEAYISQSVQATGDIQTLKAMHPALRVRSLTQFLEGCGVCEPSSAHIALTESLVFSSNPSAVVTLSGGVQIRRNYGKIEKVEALQGKQNIPLKAPCTVRFGAYDVICAETDTPCNTPFSFTVPHCDTLCLRSRQEGDAITFAYGTKTVKKLFVDEKIPAHLRDSVPIVANKEILLGVCGYGADMSKKGNGKLVRITFINNAPTELYKTSTEEERNG